MQSHEVVRPRGDAVDDQAGSRRRDQRPAPRRVHRVGRSDRLVLRRRHPRDDNGNGQTDLEVASSLADDDKVFAFVGSVSAPDDTGIGTVSRKEKIPDIGFPLTFNHSESPYTYGVPGQLQRRIIGSGADASDWLNAKHNIKQIAMFWLDESDVSRLEAWAF